MIDEFTTPDVKAQVLNQMCDGTFQYPSKGTHPVQLKKPYIMVCGNKSPETLYPNAWKYLEARFNVICLDDQQQKPIWPAILRAK